MSDTTMTLEGLRPYLHLPHMLTCLDAAIAERDALRAENETLRGLLEECEAIGPVCLPHCHSLPTELLLRITAALSQTTAPEKGTA